MNYKIVLGWIFALTPIWLLLFLWAAVVGTWQAFVGVVVLLFVCGVMIYGFELISEGQSDAYAEKLAAKRGGKS